ncbi:Signal transduction histidine kinase [Anaerosporobacter mobilis DSM 15930]|uniref:histidine kinase n=1 Tax=Anaerosporobacter mobilis DSM 15930 TaxID=1120996 RepID=A0A1M7LBW9_9FIRM|nr:HAMP domain-containing sensor histidine kinase [Anaerosporobacter mobilis]SHM75521.1 Signal transduction histidine kinase [Anaerosporobacter mobilis DSM 15930]
MIKYMKKYKVEENFQKRIIRYAILSLLITILIEAMVVGIIYLGGYVFSNRQSTDEMNIEMQSDLVENNRLADTPMIAKATVPEEIPKQSFLDKKEAVFVIAAICMVSGAILFTCLFIIYLQRYYRYIAEITEGIDRIALGDFESKIPVRYNDELSSVADTVNRLSVSIQKMIEVQRENEQSKNDLITSVAHDLRTPLTSIIGYLDLVRLGKVTDENMKQRYVGIAYNKAKRLQNLIEDLFAYTQLSFGKVTLRNSELDMVKFLEQIAEEFYPIFQDSNLEYTFRTDVTKAVVYGDGDMLERVFANLYGNAVKYGKEGEKVEAYLEEKDDTFEIRITNYGQLIPKEEIENIFERFYRVDSSRSGETGGTGLGLAIARNIVVMHGGTITATSNIGGTTFTVTLNKAI